MFQCPGISVPITPESLFQCSPESAFQYAGIRKEASESSKEEIPKNSDSHDNPTIEGSYIYILEGKIGRIDRHKSPASIIGLYTDNFTTCNILVMFSQDRRQYVLAHMDLSLNESIIENQIRWLGAEPSLFRIYRTDYAKDLNGPNYTATRCLPYLKKKFIEIGVDDRIEAVSIVYAYNQPVLSPDRPTRIQCHPKSISLAVQHSITGFTGNVGFLFPTMFDSKQWVNYDRKDYQSYERI